MKQFVLSLGLASLMALGGSLQAADPASSPAPSASPSPASKDKDKKDKLTKEEKKEKKAKDKDDSAASDPELQFPVPEGQDIKGIKIPHYGPDGKLLMLFDAQVARKLDANHVQMNDLRIDAYSDDGRKIVIAMPASVFNLEERVLTGDKGVKVTRDDFEITGNAGEFYTKTRFAKVLGNVKMIISSTEEPK